MNAMMANGTPSLRLRVRKLKYQVYCATRERKPRWSLVGGFADEDNAILYANQLAKDGWISAAVLKPREWYSYRLGSRCDRRGFRRQVVKSVCWYTLFPRV